MTAHTVTYAPALYGRSVMWESTCGCGWNTCGFDSNAIYRAAMEHGEFA